jgi:hypothetical protein
VANGRIALDEPIVLPEGAAVSVRLLKQGAAPASSHITRRQMLEFTVEERRQLLASQSEHLAELYASDADRADWQGGDIVE